MDVQLAARWFEELGGLLRRALLARKQQIGRERGATPLYSEADQWRLVEDAEARVRAIEQAVAEGRAHVAEVAAGAAPCPDPQCEACRALRRPN